MSRTKYDYDNCIGKTYNNLTFIKEVDRIKGKPRRFVCKCVCGSEKTYNGVNVLSEHTKSCGCTRTQKLIKRNKSDNPVKYVNHREKYPYDACIGTTVNHLYFVKEIERSKYNRRQFIVRCECEKEFQCEGILVFNGSVRSCGCYKSKIGEKNSTHRLTGTSEHQIWASMIQRCTNPNNESYDNYGGRGIVVCESWRDFSNFLNDMGKRPSPTHTVERLDNDGNYEPSNCVWSTRIKQNRNQRLRSDNSTGIRGVTRSGKNYLVRINANNKRITVGSFGTLEEAAKARRKAEIKYWK